MTEKQTTLHWRRWAAVCRANQWRTIGGRLADEAQASRAASASHQQVWDVAEQLAAKAHRGVLLDDLRRACYAVAASKYSSKQLSNKDFNRVLALWGLLADPVDLNAHMAWDQPELAERAGLVRFINQHAPAAYVEAITTKKHKTIFWEDLPLRDLQQLAITIKERARKWRAEKKELAADPF